MNRIKRKHRYFKLKIFILFGILVCLTLITISIKIFNVQNIETQGYLSCAGDSKPNQLQNLLGQNLFLININNIQKELQKQYLCLKQLTLTKYFPNKIKVSFIERQPKVIFTRIVSEATDSASFLESLINNASSSAAMIPQNLQKKDSFLVDENGVFFARSKGESLPKIYFLSGLNLGQEISKDLMDKILKIINQTGLFGMSTTDSLLNSDNTYFMYSNPAVYFNLNGNIDFQIASLQLILKTAKINRGIIPANPGREPDIKFIDLRFDKPIIR